MAISFCETDTYLTTAKTYYYHMLQKNFEAMAECLHPEVYLISPFMEMSGRSKVVESAKNLSHILDNIEIRATFSSGNQIMLAYDFLFSNSIGKLRASVLMEFNNHLISRIELFYDGRPFVNLENKIFD